MTLILALACSEGLIIASDSQITCSTAGQPVKLFGDKLFSLGSSIVWGVAGDVGLQQSIKTTLEKKINPGSRNNSIERLRPELKSAVIPVMKKAQEDFVPIDKNLPPPTADILFVGYTIGKPWILEIARNGSDAQHEGQGFCAVGSGDIFAYFAHQSLLHLGVSEKKLYHCQMVAYRVVDSAIKSAAYGLGGPIQMWIVNEGEAKKLTKEELLELQDTVGLWKNAEAESLSVFLNPHQERSDSSPENSPL